MQTSMKREKKKRWCDGPLQHLLSQREGAVLRPPLKTWLDWANGLLDELRAQDLFSNVTACLFRLDAKGRIKPVLLDRRYHTRLLDAWGDILSQPTTLRRKATTAKTEDHFYNALGQLLCSRLIGQYNRSMRWEKNWQDVGGTSSDEPVNDIDSLRSPVSTPDVSPEVDRVLNLLGSQAFADYLGAWPSKTKPSKRIVGAFRDVAIGRRAVDEILPLFTPYPKERWCIDAVPVTDTDKSRMLRIWRSFLRQRKEYP